MDDKKVVEWYEHPRIGELDDYVEKYFDKQCKDDYYSQFNAIHISDFKTEITRWIEDYTSMWNGLQDLVDELPNEEHEEYEVEGDEVRPLESKANTCKYHSEINDGLCTKSGDICNSPFDACGFAKEEKKC